MGHARCMKRRHFSRHKFGMLVYLNHIDSSKLSRSTAAVESCLWQTNIVKR